MDSVKDMLLLLISSSIVSNIVLSQFMGLCPFLGVSRKIKTAGGMGTAVIFVITLASAVAGVIYKFILQPLHIEYLETIVFILVIAVLGVAITNVQKEYGILTGIVNGFATALGFTIAIVILAGLREKMEYNEVPESFKGMPMVLLTAGLMAIAFCGFSGLI